MNYLVNKESDNQQLSYYYSRYYLCRAYGAITFLDLGTGSHSSIVFRFLQMDSSSSITTPSDISSSELQQTIITNFILKIASPLIRLSQTFYKVEKY